MGHKAVVVELSRPPRGAPLDVRLAPFKSFRTSVMMDDTDCRNRRAMMTTTTQPGIATSDVRARTTLRRPAIGCHGFARHPIAIFANSVVSHGYASTMHKTAS